MATKKYISKIVNGEDTAFIKDAEARESMVTSVSYNTTGKKIQKTVNGSTTDVVTAAKIISDGGAVTGSGLTADKILLGNGNSTAKTSSKGIVTSLGNDDSSVPTSKAVRDAMSGLSGAMHFIGTTTTAISDGSTTNPITIGGNSVTAGAGDVAIYKPGDVELEFVWNGTSWQEFGSTGSLKALAFKDSATGTVSCAGSNAASSVTLSGGSTSKLVTTSITGTNGTESVSSVSKTSKKLTTTSLKGVSGTLTTHDTPTLNKSNIGSASGWSAGTMFAASYSEADEQLTFTAGTAPSLTVTSTSVGTSLTAGTAQTVATANADATTVATGGLSETSATSNVGSEIVSAVSISNKTVAKAASSATTVATGSVASTGGGATVATALHTGGTAAAQTFTGSNVSVTVS